MIQIIANNLQVVCPYHLCGVQTRLTFFQLKDSLTAHFANIRVAGSFLGRDHANILQRHIREIAGEHAEDVDIRPGYLPKAISYLAPQATLNPSLELGMSR